jgi:hypothetical protein
LLVGEAPQIGEICERRTSNGVFTEACLSRLARFEMLLEAPALNEGIRDGLCSFYRCSKVE